MLNLFRTLPPSLNCALLISLASVLWLGCEAQTDRAVTSGDNADIESASGGVVEHAYHIAPYAGSLLSVRGNFLSSGLLIADESPNGIRSETQFALTVAHVFDHTNSDQEIAGYFNLELDLRDPDAVSERQPADPTQLWKIRIPFLHVRVFGQTTGPDDLALLRLVKKVPQPLVDTLPGLSKELPSRNQQVIFLGYGPSECRKEFDATTEQWTYHSSGEILKRAGWFSWRKKYYTSWANKRIDLDASRLATCIGDSGGPVVTGLDTDSPLVPMLSSGISFNQSSGEQSFMSFADVSKHRGAIIDQQTALHDTNTPRLIPSIEKCHELSRFGEQCGVKSRGLCFWSDASQRCRPNSTREDCLSQCDSTLQDCPICAHYGNEECNAGFWPFDTDPNIAVTACD